MTCKSSCDVCLYTSFVDAQQHVICLCHGQRLDLAAIVSVSACCANCSCHQKAYKTLTEAIAGWEGLNWAGAGRDREAADVRRRRRQLAKASMLSFGQLRHALITTWLRRLGHNAFACSKAAPLCDCLPQTSAGTLTVDSCHALLVRLHIDRAGDVSSLGRGGGGAATAGR